MKTQEEIEQLAEKNFPIEEYPTCEGFEHFAYKQGYTQCQNAMADNFLSLIEEYREKELPNRNVPYHYEAEIDSGLNWLIEFIKNKQDI